MEKVKHNELISKKRKRICRNLNYVQHLHILASMVTGCIYISAFASFVGIRVAITSSAETIKICVKIAGIKSSIIQLSINRKKHDKIMLLGKSKLNVIEVLISKALIGSYICHDKFASENNVLRDKGRNKKYYMEYTI